MAPSVNPQIIHQPEVCYSTADREGKENYWRAKPRKTLLLSSIFVSYTSLPGKVKTQKIQGSEKTISTPSLTSPSQMLIVHWMERNL